MIVFKCSKCSQEYRVADEYAGKKARCKSCEHINSIPMPAAKSKGPQTPFIVSSGDSVAAYNSLLQELLQQEKTAPAFDSDAK